MAVKPASAFNRLLEIHREDPDSLEFAKIGELRANVSEIKGGDQVRAARLQGVGGVNIIVRYNSQTASLSNADRLVCKQFNKTYHIRHVADLVGEGRELTITAVQHG